MKSAAHRFLELTDAFLRTTDSLLEGLKERISPGWLKAAMRIIYNAGGRIEPYPAPVIFQCNRKFKNDKKCRTPHLTEDEIKEAFVKAVNAVIPEKDELIANTKVMMRTLCDTTELEQSRFLTETKMVAEMVKRIVAENQAAAADQEEYQRRRNELVNIERKFFYGPE